MRPRRRAFTAVLVLASSLGAAAARPSVALADPVGASMDSAANHFRHGVSLYKDGDYEGALVEFRRAQDVSPNFRVLYNIGQCLYQLQRYAEALHAFEDYLGQGGNQIAPARRSDVEGDLRALRARVGTVEVAVNVAGAEIRVDDQAVGTSPLNGPILVSVGHRKITASRSDRPTLERFVDIAVGDRAKVSFDFPAPAAPPPPRDNPPPPKNEASNPPPPPPTEPVLPPSPPPEPQGSSLAWIPWTTTAILAVGTGVTGALALTTNTTLSNDLLTFPGNASTIEADRNRGKTFSFASDILLGATAVSFVVALYVTLRHPKSQASGALTPHLQLAGGPLRRGGSSAGSAPNDPSATSARKPGDLRIRLDPRGVHLVGEF